jgi:GTP cyclohydrolase I
MEPLPAATPADLTAAEPEPMPDVVELQPGARTRSADSPRPPTYARVDRARAEAAAAELLAALAIDIEGESVRETPRRIVDVYAELLTPAPFNPTTFPNDGGYDELVVAREIPFHSLCEHHLLPFTGVAHVGYLPGERIVGLSKLARVVDHFARSLQVQERLTTEIARWLEAELRPRGVGVVLEAEHSCMSLRGVRKPGATTVTSALYGVVRDDQRTRGEFLALTRRHQR